MSEESPRLSFSVAIPVLNEAAYITDTLDALLATNYPTDRLEIFVVDGGSTDGTRALVGEYADEHDAVRLLDNPDQIIPAAVNRVFDRADGDVVFHLNGHTAVDEDVFDELETALLDVAPDAGVVGPRQEPVEPDSYVGTCISAALASSVGATSKRFRDEEGYFDTINYGAYRMDVIESVGPMRTDLERAEDYELNRRIDEAGYGVYQYPLAKVYYRPRDSFGGLADQSRGNAFWKTILLDQQDRLPVALSSILPLVAVLAVSTLVVPLGVVAGVAAAVLYLLVVFRAALAVNGEASLAHVPGIVLALVVIHVSWIRGVLEASLDAGRE